MTTRTIRIRGTKIASGSRGASQPGGPEPLFRLAPGSARDGAGEEIEVKPETVVRVALENGLVLWSRADDLTREYGNPPPRGQSGAWEFTRLTPRRAASSERGMAGLAIRVLEFFGVDISKKAAGKIGNDDRGRNAVFIWCVAGINAVTEGLFVTKNQVGHL